MLDLSFTNDGREDYQHWIANDRAMLKRVNIIIKDARRNPGTGIGKPEQLRHMDGSPWSRRIGQEHRLIYSFDSSRLIVWQCRCHY